MSSGRVPERRASGRTSLCAAVPSRFVLIVGLLVCWGGSLAADPPVPQTQTTKEKKAKSKQKLLREGQRLDDVFGRFEPAGERFAFIVENSPRRFIVLENLNLERIVKMRDAYPVPIRWKISGTITEFEEENFLLIETATFSSLFRRAKPEKADDGGENEN